jgi:hypothetical protein
MPSIIDEKELDYEGKGWNKQSSPVRNLLSFLYDTGGVLMLLSSSLSVCLPVQFLWTQLVLIETVNIIIGVGRCIWRQDFLIQWFLSVMSLFVAGYIVTMALLLNDSFVTFSGIKCLDGNLCLAELGLHQMILSKDMIPLFIILIYI